MSRLGKEEMAFAMELVDHNRVVDEGVARPNLLHLLIIWVEVGLLSIRFAYTHINDPAHLT
jgi:hypothetical protein